MSTEITRQQHTTHAVSMPEKMQYAEALASASLLPRSYQRQPGNVLLAMEMGDALGIPPIQAINDIHVIEGKPSASANLIGAMVRKAGHKLRVSGDDTTATAQVIRADDPDFTFEVTWTLDRAKTAGLIKPGGNWAKYPAAMLKARAITEVARAACPDALYGVIYTPEELGAVVTEDGDPVAGASPAPQSRQQAPQQGGGSRLAQAMGQRSQPQPAAADPEPWQTQWVELKQALAEAGLAPEEDRGELWLAKLTELTGASWSHPNQISPEAAAEVVAMLATPVPEADIATGEIVDEPAA